MDRGFTSSQIIGKALLNRDRLFLPLIVLFAVGALGLTGPVQAQVSILGSIDVPDQPYDVAVDTLRGRLYVAVEGDAPSLPDDDRMPSIEVIDYLSGSLITSIPLTSTPEYLVLSAGGDLLIVRHFYDLKFTVIDTADFSTSEVTEPGATTLQALVSPARPGTAWLLYGYLGETPGMYVGQTNLSVPAIERGINLPAGQPLAEGAVTPDGLRAIIPSPSLPPDVGFASIVSLEGPIDEAEVTTLEVGSFPLHVVASADGLTAYAANTASNTVSIIDVATGGIIAEPEILTAAEPHRIALFDDDQRIATVCPADSAVQLLDVSGTGVAVEEHRLSMSGLSSIPPVGAPVVLDYAGIMLVAQSTGDLVSVVDVDPQSGNYGAFESLAFPSGSYPARIAVDTSRGLAWVAPYFGSSVMRLSIPKAPEVFESSFESGTLVGWTVVG